MAEYEVTSRRPIARMFRRTADAAVKSCVRFGIAPDAISYLSILAAMFAAFCFWKSAGRPWLLLLAPLFCYVRLWFNMLDGMVAVAAGKTSLRGEIVNDLPDRISDVMIFAGVAHSGWMNPFLGYWAAISAVLAAYVGLFGQALGVGREFGGVMSKPWRMAALHLGAWLTFFASVQTRPIERLTILDWTCLVIIAGCVQTIVVRLKQILRSLNSKSNPHPTLSPRERGRETPGEGNPMMSPQIALNDPIFRAYLVIVPASLAAGGLVLAFLRFGLRKNLGSVWATYRSWLVMATLGLVVVFAGRVPVIIGVALLSIFAFKEFARASGLYRDWWMTGAVYAGIATVGVASLMPHPRGEEPGQGWYGFFVAVPVFAIALILLIPILRNRARGELQKMSLSIVGFIYIGWMFGHLGFLANAVNAYGFVCYVIFATELNDVSAFTFGKLLGRHPLRSEISPNKTWEGALGALAVSMVLPWLLRFSFPFFGAKQLILTGLIVGIGGLLGDLSISVIKRDIGTKDMGAAIPGHGGILDRIDSLIYVAPLFMHMAGYYYGLR